MNIEFEPLETLQKWLKAFDAEPDRLILPDCPYSYYQVRDEILRRDFIQGVMEDLGK